jgi:Fe-S cluster assembly iron-binding protein IscA
MRKSLNVAMNKKSLNSISFLLIISVAIVFLFICSRILINLPQDRQLSEERGLEFVVKRLGLDNIDAEKYKILSHQVYPHRTVIFADIVIETADFKYWMQSCDQTVIESIEVKFVQSLNGSEIAVTNALVVTDKVFRNKNMLQKDLCVIFDKNTKHCYYRETKE